MLHTKKYVDNRYELLGNEPKKDILISDLDN